MLTSIVLTIGVILRAYFVFFKGHNVDEYVSLGFISFDGLSSAFWDNHPPLFYLVGKLLKLWPAQTKTIIEVFIFVCSVLSMLLLNKLNNIRPQFLGALLIAAFPVTIINCTIIRPTALIELLVIGNFYIFWKYLENKAVTKAQTVFGILTTLALIATTYVSFIYFFICAAIYLNQRNFKVSKFKLGVIVAFLGLLGFILSYIAWPTLGWIDADEGILQTFESAAVLVRNIFGYSWTILAIVAILAIVQKNYFLIGLMLLAFAINPILGTKAIEPRFIYPLAAVSFILFLNAIQKIQIEKLKTAVIVVSAFFYLWVVAWFVKTERSGFEEAIGWMQSQQINAVGDSISLGAYKGIGVEMPVENLQSEKCPLVIGVPFPTHAAGYKNGKFFRDALAHGFRLKSVKLFSEGGLEPVNVWIFEKDCL